MASNVIYLSIPQFLESCKTTKDRIEAIDNILNQMEIALSNAATTGQFKEYRLDTGQTKNEIVYRSLSELNLSYMQLLHTQELLRQRLNNQKQGRIFRMVNGKNF